MAVRIKRQKTCRTTKSNMKTTDREVIVRHNLCITTGADDDGWRWEMKFSTPPNMLFNNALRYFYKSVYFLVIRVTQTYNVYFQNLTSALIQISISIEFNYLRRWNSVRRKSFRLQPIEDIIRLRSLCSYCLKKYCH